MNLTKRTMLIPNRPRTPVEGWERSEELILAARHQKPTEELIEDTHKKVDDTITRINLRETGAAA